MSDTARERERFAAYVLERYGCVVRWLTNSGRPTRPHMYAKEGKADLDSEWQAWQAARAEQEPESGEAWDWAEQAVSDYECSECENVPGRDELRTIIHDALTGFARAEHEQEPDEPDMHRCECGRIVTDGYEGDCPCKQEPDEAVPREVLLRTYLCHECEARVNDTMQPGDSVWYAVEGKPIGGETEASSERFGPEKTPDLEPGDGDFQFHVWSGGGQLEGKVEDVYVAPIGLCGECAKKWGRYILKQRGKDEPKSDGVDLKPWTPGMSGLESHFDASCPTCIGMLIRANRGATFCIDKDGALRPVGDGGVCVPETIKHWEHGEPQEPDEGKVEDVARALRPFCAVGDENPAARAAIRALRGRGV